MCDTLKHIFSKKLNYYLKKNGKTQTDLINELNLSPSTVSEWCSGKKYPRIGKIQLLADYFNIDKSDLIEEKNNDNINISEQIKAIYGSTAAKMTETCLRLDKTDQIKITGMAEMMLTDEKYTKDTPPSAQAT